MELKVTPLKLTFNKIFHASFTFETFKRVTSGVGKKRIPNGFTVTRLNFKIWKRRMMKGEFRERNL